MDMDTCFLPLRSCPEQSDDWGLSDQIVLIVFERLIEGEIVVKRSICYWWKGEYVGIVREHSHHKLTLGGEH